MKFKTAKINLFSLYLLSGLIFLSGCTPERFDKEIPDSGLHITVERFDRDLFVVTKEGRDTFHQKMIALKSKYGSFTDLFFERIINIGPVNQPSTGMMLNDFLTDHDINTVYGECLKTFADIRWLEDDLTRAFIRYQYFFPDRYIPVVVAFVSGFNFSVITADSTVGIGLDMYLGKDYSYYAMLGFPEYRRWNMNKNAMATDCLRAWLLSEFLPDPSKNELLYSMVHHGKVLFAMKMLFPAAHDSLIAGYSSKQIEWCRRNEPSVWAFFIDKKLLWSTDLTENAKYTGEGPFTSGMPAESPGGIGRWVGWQIVTGYMEKNEEESLDMLMKEGDAQKILQGSKYKPRT